ncbi:MAG: efflux RND transporter periplasmic adaptor subunit [Bacteroidetes bacterium]|nr:efflux RND transporter periplasmic adaptor subunit [Bacteroidota bacterium]MDA0943100.1 efflux RND transporter periplasmic adaptor subunit [Bacteroidota bacterium]MDA1111299.1 efflux RND transporter periplasmic adaptor subunit [Bacteroidota bacterium]
MNKKWIWIAGLSLVGIVIVASIKKGGTKTAEVETTEVTRRDITELVSVSGKIQPEFEVKISADVSGEIIELAVAEGDTVRQGQLLLRINPELYETTLNQLRANLDNAMAGMAASEAQLEKAKANVLQQNANAKRLKPLFEAGAISLQEWENAQLQQTLAKSDALAAEKNALGSQYNVKSLQARLEEGRRNLGRTSIYAPTAGVVTQLSAEKGERVVGTQQMTGTEIMRISNLDRMEVQVNINENDIVRVRVGNEADVRVDAYPGKTFKGKVVEVANSARFNAATPMNDQSSNFIVKVQLDPASYQDLQTQGQLVVFPGMTATVDIHTRTSSQALSIPISALCTRSFGDSISSGQSVFVLSDGKAVIKSIEVGVQDLDYYEVLSGLKEGDVVISGPTMTVAKTLQPGEKVKTKSP